MDSKRQKMYDCRLCQKTNRIEKFNCFWFGDEEQDVEINATIKDEYDNPVCTQGERKTMTPEDVDNLLIDVTDAHPDWSALQALRIICPGVCPKSLITKQIDELLIMESFCRDYHMPLLGDTPYLDYPLGFRDMIWQVGVTRERVRAQEIKRATEKNQ